MREEEGGGGREWETETQISSCSFSYVIMSTN